MKILFICRTNVGRSQIAASLWKKLFPLDDIKSAGVGPIINRRIHPTQEVIHVMAEEGIDVSNNIIKMLTNDMVVWAEKLIILCEKALCPDYVFNSKKEIIWWAIEDKAGKNTDEVREIKDIIKQKIINYKT